MLASCGCCFGREVCEIPVGAIEVVRSVFELCRGRCIRRVMRELRRSMGHHNNGKGKMVSILRCDVPSELHLFM